MADLTGAQTDPGADARPPSFGQMAQELIGDDDGAGTRRVHASLRPDTAGVGVDYLRVDQSYQQRVMRMWEFFHIDPLFKKLIERGVDFACTGGQWEIHPPTVQFTSWLDRAQHRDQELEIEESIWNSWAARINEGVPNCLPGMEQIDRWAARHLLLSGMFVAAWEWGTFQYGQLRLEMPVRLTCYPASQVVLSRPQGLWNEEQMFLYRPPGALTHAIEGHPLEAPSHTLVTLPPTRVPGRGGPRLAGMIPLPALGGGGPTEAFALKYQWDPGGLTLAYLGGPSKVGQGIYPVPPYYALLKPLLIRQKLFASDLAILDGLIRYLLIFSVGDKDNLPRPPVRSATGDVLEPGTLATVRQLIQHGRTGEAVELFLPYWVKVSVLTPPTETLLSETKYAASAQEMMACFPPDALVTTRRGHVPIADVVIGDHVLTHRGRWRRVTQVHERPYAGELVGLSTGTHRRLWCTPGHTIWSRYRKKYVYGPETNQPWRLAIVKDHEPEPALWRLAGGLEWGDLVLQPTPPPLPETETWPRLALWTPAPGYRVPRDWTVPRDIAVDPAVAYMLGLYCAEGCVLTSPRVRGRPMGLDFGFHRRETDLQLHVMTVLRERFGLRSRLKTGGNRASVVVCSRRLAETIRREFGQHQLTRRAPAWLLDAPRAVVAAWLRGLFKGDGHRTAQGKWQLAISSQEMAYQALDSVRRLGFRATIADYVNPGRTGSTRRLWWVNTSSRGVSFDVLMQTGLCPTLAPQESWVPLRRPITKPYAGLVYDLTVDEDHTFTVEGVSVSNSFGIFFSRSPSGNRERMEKINITGFEQQLRTVQQHLSGFWSLIASEIRRRNRRLHDLPRWTWNPINTKDEAFAQELRELMKVGGVSFETIMRHLGKEPDVELRRIAMEMGLDVDDLRDLNVPTSYRQTVVESPRTDVGKPGPVPPGDVGPGGLAPPPDAPPTGRAPRRARRPARKTVSVSPTLLEGRPPE